MCIAALQNQEKNTTCQNVNFVCPARGSPPVQIRSCAIFQKSPGEVTPSCFSAMNPQAMKTRTIQGTDVFATRTMASYPLAATRANTPPITTTTATQAMLVGSQSVNAGIGMLKGRPTAVAETETMAPARKQKRIPFARL